jgi:putative peptidoglycan lipid II flippase
MPDPASPQDSASNAAWVGIGILLSRIAGLIRERVFAHYFGNSLAADAFRAAARIPNLLQNLFGEGVLSASFIPVYSRLRARGEDQSAAEVASAVGSLLALVVSTLVALGVLGTPWLVDLIAPGFEGERRTLTVLLVRILFPGIGLLALSAWCLGVLNSHRRFFLAYAAPILWNLAQIGALIVGGIRASGPDLAAWVAGGAVVGSVLQFGVQLPLVFRLLRTFSPSLDLENQHVREVLRSFGPVVVGRGVVQISAYVDSILASWLPTGAVAALAYAQILYLLPISLFGMAVSAAELPEMASVLGGPEQVYASLRARLGSALVRIAFFVVPSSVAFWALGDVVSAALFQTGRFSHQDAVYVWAILGGATVGLLAATSARLYASAFYALGDPKSPLRFAVVRLVLAAGLGWLSALLLPGWLGLGERWGAVGLTASGGVVGWVEFLLLRRRLHARLGRVTVGGVLGKIWAAALLAALLAWGVGRLLPASVSADPLLTGVLVLTPFGAVYSVLAWWFGVPLARELGRSLVRRWQGRSG